MKRVLGRCDSEEFFVVIEAGGTLAMLDIGLGDKCKHTVDRLQEGGIAPADVPSVSRFSDAAEIAHRQGLVRSCEGKEPFVGVCPLLHPTFSTFDNAVGGKFFGQYGILEVGEFITEGDAVVIKAYNHSDILTQG